MVKKTVSYILLILFLYNTAGYYPHYLIRQFLIKEGMEVEMKKELPESQLTKLRFSTRDYRSVNWLGENELCVAGRFYDVVRTYQESSGYIVLLCLDDKKEKDLEAALEEQTDTNYNHSNSVKHNLAIFKLLANLFLASDHQMYIMPPTKTNFPAFTGDSPVSFFSEITVPPPRLA